MTLLAVALVVALGLLVAGFVMVNRQSLAASQEAWSRALEAQSVAVSGAAQVASAVADGVAKAVSPPAPAPSPAQPQPEGEPLIDFEAEVDDGFGEYVESLGRSGPGAVMGSYDRRDAWSEDAKIEGVEG